MPTEDAYSSGHLVLSHFGTCMCSNVETNLSWTCLVSGLLNFEYPSVLLFCIRKEVRWCTWRIRQRVYVCKTFVHVKNSMKVFQSQTQSFRELIFGCQRFQRQINWCWTFKWWVLPNFLYQAFEIVLCTKEDKMVGWLVGCIEGLRTSPLRYFSHIAAWKKEITNLWYRRSRIAPGPLASQAKSLNTIPLLLQKWCFRFINRDNDIPNTEVRKNLILTLWSLKID